MADDWNPLWPDPDLIRAILRDNSRWYRIPKGLSKHTRPTPAAITMLMRDPPWLLWIMNPRMDTLIRPREVKAAHWVNMVLCPLHGPCRGAIRSMAGGHAFLQRVRCGEVVQSHRPRYVGSANAHLDVL